MASTITIRIPNTHLIRSGQASPAYSSGDFDYDLNTIKEDGMIPRGIATSGVRFPLNYKWKVQPILLIGSTSGAIIEAQGDSWSQGEVSIIDIGSKYMPDNGIDLFLPLSVPIVVDKYGALMLSPIQPPMVSNEMLDLFREITEFRFTLNEYLGRKPVMPSDNKIEYDDIKAAFGNGVVAEFNIIPRFANPLSYNKTNVIFRYKDRRGQLYATIVNYNPVTNEVAFPIKR